MPGGFGDHDPNDEGGRYGNQGAVNPLDPSVANGMITPAQWDAYQKRRSRDRILGILGLAGATTGLGFLGQALGGAGAAGAAGGSGSLAPIAGGAPWAVTPYATTATMAGSGIGAGAGLGAGAGAGAGMFGAGLTGRDLLSLGLAGAGAVGGAMQPRPNLNPNTTTSDPNLQRLLQTMQGRLDKSEPLYDSIMAMANGLLPTQYQRGGGGAR